jgi:CheY-like chemotaxis protein
LWLVYFQIKKLKLTPIHAFYKYNNLKALIIDDEVDICYLLSSILKQKNCQTHYVNNIADAIVELKNSSPVIVFLDNHLPDGLGIEFVDHIKRNYPSIKIIMITAYDTIADRQQAIEKGVDIFIGKPFTKEAISNAMEAVIN